MRFQAVIDTLKKLEDPLRRIAPPLQRQGSVNDDEIVHLVEELARSPEGAELRRKSCRSGNIINRARRKKRLSTAQSCANQMFEDSEIVIQAK